MSYYFLAISSLYREKNLKKSFEDIAEHLFNHCKSKFLAEVFVFSVFSVYLKRDAYVYYFYNYFKIILISKLFENSASLLMLC